MNDHSLRVHKAFGDDRGVGDWLPLMEEFYTIQGEGFHQGKAATFVRWGGCDVGCVWCDVKESWDASRHKKVDIASIFEALRPNASKIVVITGGEPCMYDLDPLTNLLQGNGYATHLETSGAYRLTGQWDWICVSPKKFKRPLENVLARAHELKVVIYHPSDITWANTFLDKINKDCKCFLQPEWSRSDKVMPLILDCAKKDPRWEISLQIHKFMNIP